jgi:ABC transporter with metal-binding/Fe-S-binding domain ATP-binding protein
MSVRIASLFSGGKDSAYALFCALQQGYDVHSLVTVAPAPDSMMFHHPNVELTVLQAKAIGIPHTFVRPKTKASEDELDALKLALAKMDIDAIVSGAVESEYQKQRLDVICDELGIRSFAPLWRKEPIQLLRDMVIDAGLEILVVSVSADGLEKEWLGRKLDGKAIDELAQLQKSHGVHPIFEGGEGETFVTYAPFFSKRIKLEKSEINWGGSAGTMEITKASLAAA